MSLAAFYHRVEELLGEGRPFVVATIVDTIGSVPQVTGARMIVTEEGRNFGTVGGGKVENRALQEAQSMLVQLSAESHSSPKTRFVSWSLEKDIGMTCGGSVRLYFEAHNLAVWNIAIFGAGHCASALIALLGRLDCSITCIDPRQEWLDRLPETPRLKRVRVSEYKEGIKHLSRDSFVLLLSMGHSTDSPVLMEIFKGYEAGENSFPYLGVIGSKAKAVRLRQDVETASLPDKYKQAFLCPIGLEIGNNDPQEIAVSIAAQLIQERDRLAQA